MKTLLKHIGVLLALAMLVGCATTGKSLATTAQTVDSAMKGWAMYVVTTNPPQNQQDQVKAAYEKYQLALDVALTSYQQSVTLGDASIYEKANASLSASKVSLLALIEAFNPTINGGK